MWRWPQVPPDGCPEGLSTLWGQRPTSRGTLFPASRIRVTRARRCRLCTPRRERGSPTITVELGGQRRGQGGPELGWSPQGKTPCPFHFLEGRPPPGNRDRSGWTHKTGLSSRLSGRVGSYALSAGSQAEVRDRWAARPCVFLGALSPAGVLGKSGTPAPQSQTSLCGSGLELRDTPAPTLCLSDRPHSKARLHQTVDGVFTLFEQLAKSFS